MATYLKGGWGAAGAAGWGGEGGEGWGWGFPYLPRLIRSLPLGTSYLVSYAVTK